MPYIEISYELSYMKVPYLDKVVESFPLLNYLFEIQYKSATSSSASFFDYQYLQHLIV